MGWKVLQDKPTEINKTIIVETISTLSDKLDVLQGLYLNIPDMSGGVGSVIESDINSSYRLNDNNYIIPVGDDTPYMLTSSGNSIGLELSKAQSIKTIKLYFSTVSLDSALIDNMLNVFYSTDGVTWLLFYEIQICTCSLTVFENFSCLTINLPSPCTTKYIAIRTLNTLFYHSGINREVHITEMDVFSSFMDFGNNDDKCYVQSTDELFKKINGFWVRIPNTD